MEDVFKTLHLSDENEIFRGYSTMIELYNALKFITMLFFIQKILRFYLGAAFFGQNNNFLILCNITIYMTWYIKYQDWKTSHMAYRHPLLLRFWSVSISLTI